MRHAELLLEDTNNPFAGDRKVGAMGRPSLHPHEDDILLAVVPRAGTAPTAAEVAQWCRSHLAANKVPRYVVFADSLPHTPTHRVAKFRLREDRSLLARAVDLASSAKELRQ